MTVNTGVAITSVKPVAVQKIRLTLTNIAVAIADADAYGSARLIYTPDINYLVVGAEAVFTWVKDGVGIVTGELPKLALGTAAASNATLATTMSNILNGGATAGTAVASGLTGSWGYHSADNASTALPLTVTDTPATNAIYLNASVNPTGDGTITVSGYLDLFIIPLGNLNS